MPFSSLGLDFNLEMLHAAINNKSEFANLPVKMTKL